jgi:hypothetical protein
MERVAAPKALLGLSEQIIPQNMESEGIKKKSRKISLFHRKDVCLQVNHIVPSLNDIEMSELQNLPIGIQNFESLRKDGYIYVDKTELVYSLVTSGRYYFLSRPRRFGKSLFLSTLHAYFEGKKELFEGTAIARLEKDWTKYPVLHLDLNLTRRLTEGSLGEVLDEALKQWEKLYPVDEPRPSLELRFKAVVEQAYRMTGKKVVILVDEYDKPILQTIEDEKIQQRYRDILKAFYGVLKSMDGYIKFAFLTGVTKFGKVSVFSDLNNLNDISMDKRYATICGLTDEEIDSVLPAYIQRLAEEQGMTAQEARDKLRSLYDGYHFLPNSPAIYNPFSVLNTLDKLQFGSYWFETGTPSYLVYLLKLHHYDLGKLTHAATSAKAINSTDSQSTDPIPVIYQSGYLTIKDYDPEFKVYELGFPNKEVEEGFFDFLLPYYASVADGETSFQLRNFVNELRTGQTEAFLKRLSSFFADTPYELVKDLENHYQNVLFILTKLMGFYVDAERRTSAGRIDLFVRTPQYAYVMEFKLDGTAEEALQQIHDRQYALPFAVDQRKLICVGVNFSSRTRNIERWMIEE